jgi:hypothetical protein
MEGVTPERMILMGWQKELSLGRCDVTWRREFVGESFWLIPPDSAIVRHGISLPRWKIGIVEHPRHAAQGHARQARPREHQCELEAPISDASFLLHC